MAIHKDPPENRATPWLADAERWCALGDLGSRRLRAAASSSAALFDLWRREGSPRLDSAQLRALADWAAAGHSVVRRWDADFPAPLKTIPDAPVLLFVRGCLAVLRQPRVAMVGSRNASHAGAAIARRLAGELARCGVLIVSGLAQGIDRAAHEGALQERRPTVAIPGSGLVNLYPRRHQGLARQILGAGGLLVSEYAPWVAPHRASFPARNRLISGLSVGVVVVQAALKSGSLITARLAGEQGREVMAVPGAPGTPGSEGCNALLRDGAALIESVVDISTALGWDLSLADSLNPLERNADAPALTADSQLVLRALDGIPVSLDGLTQFVGLPLTRVQRALLQLQLAGLVRATTHGYIRDLQ